MEQYQKVFSLRDASCKRATVVLKTSWKSDLDSWEWGKQRKAVTVIQMIRRIGLSFETPAMNCHS
jgi:hypothetical protein